MGNSKEQQKYFNFPIVLLQDFLVNDTRVLSDIYAYALYVQTISYYNYEKEGFDWVVNQDIEKGLDLAISYFGININSNKLKAFKAGYELHNSIPENAVKVGLNISIFLDYLRNDKTEFQKLCLLGFLAIKSIIGRSKLCKTNNALLVARMNGSTSVKECKDLCPYLKRITETKYKTRYYIQDKLIPELEINWGLNYWSDRNRGFYVSFIVGLEKLASISNEAKMKHKKEKLKNQKQEIKAKLKTTP